MVDENVRFFPTTTADPDLILSKARDWGLTEVMVIGWKENGEFQIGGSNGSLRDMSWLIKNAEYWIDNAMRNE